MGYIQHQQLQRQISRVMFLPPTTPSEEPEEEYLQPKSHPKGSYSLIKFPRYPPPKLVR